MAICKECGGQEWTEICQLHRHSALIPELNGKEMADGSLWQCDKCKRIIHVNNWGNGNLSATGVRV